MIFVRLISTCRFTGLSSIIVALRVEFNFAIHIAIHINKNFSKRLTIPIECFIICYCVLRVISSGGRALDF
jgi:hypothetical protein